MEFSTSRIIFIGVLLVFSGCYLVWIAIKVFFLGKPHINWNYRVAINIVSLVDKEKAKQIEEKANSQNTIKRNAISAAIGGPIFIILGLWNLFSVL